MLNSEGKRYWIATNIDKTKTLVFGNKNMDLSLSVEEKVT